MHVPLFSQGFREHLSENVVNIYRPQRSCGKVMFSQASVILLTGGRVSARSVCVVGTHPGRPPWANTPPPPGRHSPADTTPWANTPQAGTPMFRPPRQTPPGQTDPHAQCMHKHTHTCPVHAGIHALPPVATAADGSHPTGMHSCCKFNWY